MNLPGKYIPVFIASSFMLLFAQVCNAQPVTVIPHDLLPTLRVVVEGENQPHWKLIWDEARGLAISGDFPKALRKYEALLSLKNNLDEARWELVRLHMHLDQSNKASEQLELLIESDPQNSKYLVALGRVMYETEQYERAVDLFKTVYDKNPADQIALAGLIEGLNKLGRKDEALLLLERLSLQEPSNLGVRRNLALIYYDSGGFEKARPHLVILSGQDNVETEILYKTALVHEKIGQSHIGVNYWQRILEREPDHMEAHSYLASYYDEIGQPESVLLHLQAIQETSPSDKGVLARIGRAYEKQGDYDKALTFYQRYLEQYPGDRQVLKRLVKIHAVQGRKTQTLATLDQYFASEQKKDTEELKEKARHFDAAGRYHDAIALYRQLVELSPDDPEILGALANDLLAIGANEGALSMWKHLSELAPNDLSVYRSMAELLRRLGRNQELLEVLHKLHILDPADSWATLQIAVLYLEQDEFYKSKKYFDKLSGSACVDIECLQPRGLLYERIGLAEHALHDYEEVLGLVPGRYQIRLRAMSLAADLGLLDKALAHRKFFETNLSDSHRKELVLLTADAYRHAGALTESVKQYQAIIDQSIDGPVRENEDLRQRAWLGIAAAYQSGGHYYEADQALRTALANSDFRSVYLRALVELSIASGNVKDSETWYDSWINELQIDAESRETISSNWQVQLLRAKIYAADGNYDSAINLCSKLQMHLPLSSKDKSTDKDKVTNYMPGVQVRLDLVNYLIADGEYGEAEKVAEQLLGIAYESIDILMALEQIYTLSGETIKAQEYGVRAITLAEEDLERLLRLADLYENYKNIAGQYAAALAAVHKEPASFSANIAYIRATIASGSLIEALDLSSRFHDKLPGSNWFTDQQIKLLARVGRFEEALKLVGDVVDSNPERADILLVKARVLWQQNLWKDSVTVYKSYMTPAVEEILEQQISQQDMAVDLTPQNTLWNTITFSEAAPLSISELVMSPHHVVDFSENIRPINQVAASHYALYRWQKRFKRELAVRKLVQRRYYHYAATKLESLIKEYDSDEFLIFDLAGLYSKLDLLQEEAFLYGKLERSNSHFPGLQKAVQRNGLKRRPRVSLAYTMQEDDGWHGYKAIRRKAADLTGWYSSSTNSDWSLNLQRIKYDSTNNGDSLKSWRTMISLDTKLNQAFNLSLGAGLENLEDGYDTTPLYYAAIIGKIRDEMRATLSFRQDVTADTIDSLTEDITLRQYKIDILFDLMPRVLMGGDFQYTDYSDNNWTNKYTFWSSYLFIPEPTLLKVSYKFDAYDSDEGFLSPLPPSQFGFSPNDHPYWAPIDYWITRFSFYFKHQLSNDTLARGVPSYYTLEYSLGYDSDDNDLHEVKGSINVELFKHLTLKATYGYTDLDVYNHEEAHISAMYRW